MLPTETGAAPLEPNTAHALGAAGGPPLGGGGGAAAAAVLGCGLGAHVLGVGGATAWTGVALEASCAGGGPLAVSGVGACAAAGTPDGDGWGGGGGDGCASCVSLSATAVRVRVGVRSG